MSGELRIVVSGHKDAGKSSLLAHFIDDIYPSSKLAGLYANGVLKTLDLQGSDFKLRLFEYSKREGDRYYPDDRMFQKVDGVLLVIDATDYESFRNLERFVQTAQCGMSRSTVVMVVLNKMDDESQQKVDSSEVKRFCEERGLLYGETSAKTGKSVEQVFRDLSFAMQAKKQDGKADVLALQRESDRARTEPRDAAIAAIRLHIETLQREILSTFACHRGLKQLKIYALVNLIEAIAREERSSIRTLITQARTANPFLNKGLFSHRTRDLLSQYSQ
jgi:small GTP-binding protein